MTPHREQPSGWIRAANGAPGLATPYLDSRPGGTLTRDGALGLAVCRVAAAHAARCYGLGNGAPGLAPTGHLTSRLRRPGHVLGSATIMQPEARAEGRIDRSLARSPLWQLGGRQQRKRVERRDVLGSIARADRAPLGEPELDVLTWLTQEWFDHGCPLGGKVRFTWYSLGRDLYGGGRRGWSPSGRYRELMREALDNLHAVVLTFRSIDIDEEGGRMRKLHSKVHILERIDDHEEVELLRDGEGSQAVVGALRGESVEVTFAPWLVDRLLDEGVVLSWRTQRQLSGAAKRLWYELSARFSEFEPTGLPGETELMIEVSGDFFAAMNLQAARDRDNRTALAAAARRVVAVDDRFRSIDLVKRDGAHFLRARSAEGSAAPAV
jgi:hypothetical protein